MNAGQESQRVSQINTGWPGHLSGRHRGRESRVGTRPASHVTGTRKTPQLLRGSSAVQPPTPTPTGPAAFGGPCHLY